MGSFFNKDDYVYRNLVKTVKLYKNLTAFEAVPAASAGVIMATGSDVTDFLAIVLILFFGIMVWLKEKEDGMLVIIRTSKNGRMRLGFTKFAVLVTSVVLVGILLYLSGILAAVFTYGLGDVTRSIVTVSEYIGALWRVSVIGFLGLNLLVKLVVYVWIAALVSVLCTAISGPIAAVGGVVFASLINYVLYEKIPALSKFMAIKYLNPYAVIKTQLIFTGYKGLYFFGYSFDYRKCLLIVLGVGILAFVYLSLRLFAKSPLRGNRRKHFIAVKAFNQYIRMRRRMEKHVSIARHEFHRIFIYAWILPFLILVLIFQASNGKTYNIGYKDVTDYFVRMYLKELSGPVTEEKKLYLETESERLNDSTDTLEKEQKKAVKEVMTRLLYLDKNEGTYILYDEPMGLLTAADGNREDIVNALFFVVLLAFMMPFFFAPEWNTGMIKIISVTLHGRRKLTRIRYVMGIVLVLVTFVLTYMPLFVKVLVSNGVEKEWLLYPAGSVMNLSKYGTGINIMQYFVLLGILRVIAGILLAMFIYKISAVIKNSLYTVALTLGVFGGPMIIALLESRLEIVMYPLSLFAGNMFIQNSIAALVCVLTIAALMFLLKVLIKRKTLR